MSITSREIDTSTSSNTTRRYPIGAEILGDTVSFRVWVPSREHVAIRLEDGSEHAMNREDGGYFRLDLEGLGAGTLYRFRLDSSLAPAADPASRFQPEGPLGYSAVIDPHDFEWSDADWTGITPNGQVLYEMHIGTFTAEGTYAAASEKLPFLKEIGITCLEIMPLNEFCGEFGWGYDGVLPYAPTRLYGTPDDLRSFIDTAHQLDIGVILDVVYNHFGVGNRFRDFTPAYFTERYWNEWGSSINFDGENIPRHRQRGWPRVFFGEEAFPKSDPNPRFGTIASLERERMTRLFHAIWIAQRPIVEKSKFASSRLERITDRHDLFCLPGSETRLLIQYPLWDRFAMQICYGSKRVLTLRSIPFTVRTLPDPLPSIFCACYESIARETRRYFTGDRNCGIG